MRTEHPIRIAAAALLTIALTLPLLVSSGCSTRAETPTLAPDSTLVYAGKRSGDLSATITLASKSKMSKKTGRRLGIARAFDLGTDEKVYAFVDLANVHGRGERPLGFHLVWLDPDDETIFKKMLEYAPNDTAATLTSVLSIPQGKRPPGEYKFRVYLFRELIAEKGFTLRGEALVPEKGKGGAGEM